MEALVPYLQKVLLFSALTAEQLKQFAIFCSLGEYNKDEHVFHEGDYARAFYSVVRGKLKIYRLSADGVEHILEIQEPPDMIAEAAIFDRETYPANCQALENVTLLRIPRQEFVKLLLSSEKVTLAILNSYSKRLRDLVKLVEALSMYDVKARLGRYLLKKAVTRDGRLVYEHKTTKKELAAILGTIPETLSRTFNFFKDRGLISEEGKTIVILDVKQMQLLL